MHRFLVLIALIFGISAGTQLWAQEGGLGEVPGQAEITESQLQLFVDVQDDIQDIVQDYSARLEGTEDPEAAAQLQQEASQMMVAAVEDIGLDVATYNNIAVALEQDEDLQERVREMMQ